MSFLKKMGIISLYMQMAKVWTMCNGCGMKLKRPDVPHGFFCRGCKNRDSEKTYRCRGCRPNGQCANYVVKAEYDEDSDPHNYLFDDARPECLCSSCKRNRVKSIDQVAAEEQAADKKAAEDAEKRRVQLEAAWERPMEKSQKHYPKSKRA